MSGAIKVEVQSKKQNVAHFWFHTAFIDGMQLTMPKSQIDKACKDKHHKRFDSNMKIEIFFDKNIVETGKEMVGSIIHAYQVR